MRMRTSPLLSKQMQCKGQNKNKNKKEAAKQSSFLFDNKIEIQAICNYNYTQLECLIATLRLSHLLRWGLL